MSNKKELAKQPVVYPYIGTHAINPEKMKNKLKTLVHDSNSQRQC